jgi:hypothetical protein
VLHFPVVAIRLARLSSPDRAPPDQYSRGGRQAHSERARPF